MTEITPEMILDGPSELREQLLKLFQKIWSEAAVVDDWKNAEIIPIPKKGALKVCDNWRGISLLDVVGKVFARIVQSRLQRTAEGLLPDSQCGFRPGRGCADMIFVARQLVEKTLEHNDSLFILFVDLRKAYDSVPRSALWEVLRKYGIPPTMLNIIKSSTTECRPRSEWCSPHQQALVCATVSDRAARLPPPCSTCTSMLWSPTGGVSALRPEWS